MYVSHESLTWYTYESTHELNNFTYHISITLQKLFLMGNQNLIEKTYWFDYFIETEISKCYKMVSCPHGKCIIINIMNFDGHALITR